MKCPRCLNEEKKYFYLGEKGYYCRRCVKFGRIYFDEEFDSINDIMVGKDAEYQFGFELSKKQEDCSRLLIEKNQESDVLVYAACGAGKTEIVMELISQYLRQGKKVGFAIPRRQVVIQLQERLARYFTNIRVQKVCGGFTAQTEGDLIICTTHQLFRYYQSFDLLIIDEPDAYPYEGNLVLQGIAATACRGRRVYLSATPNSDLLALPQVQLFERPHGYPLVVPKIIFGFSWMLFLQLIYFMKRNQRNMIFVPTIVLAEKMAKVFKTICIHSKTLDKEELLQAFVAGKYRSIFCTTIMERGITIENVNVCVWQADHDVFSESSLIQILGRIGRSANYPKGEGLLLCKERKESVFGCIQTIKRMNA